MNRNLGIGTTLLAALLACGLVACTSSETSAGGTGGTIAPPVGTGGAIGEGGTAGTTTAPATGLGILCPPPAQLITDFAYSVDAGTADVRFGGNGMLSGGGSYFPNSGANAVTQDLTQGNWHISGTAREYTGFNLYFDNCDRVDASAFKGISFTLSGTVGNGPLTMSVNTAGDTATGVWKGANGKAGGSANDVGRCTPPCSQCPGDRKACPGSTPTTACCNGDVCNSYNQYYAPGCNAPAKAIPVPATPTTISVTWAELIGGTPDATVNPKEITEIAWRLYWADPAPAPYAFDIVMDNLAFIP